MDFEDVLTRQESVSRTRLKGVVSATGLVHGRPGLGHTVRPAPGSVLASSAFAHWDPLPDYAYHWVRDAAVVMLLAPHLCETDPSWQEAFAHYVAFSLQIATRPAPQRNPLRDTAAPDHTRFLRPDDELAALAGAALLGEPRANADGTVDCERWSRPQFDGPALRALSCLGWRGPTPVGIEALLRLDLDHVIRHAAQPCIGPWEEEPPAQHAFTLLAQRAALETGRERVDEGACGEALARIEAALDALVAPEGHLRASSVAPQEGSDANIILGALLQADPAGSFGVRDPRMIATERHVRTWSREAFPVSREERPLVGRWREDVYFGGNPWLPTSLGFAEFHFLRAVHGAAGDAEAAVAAGDAFLSAVAACLDAPGDLSEQLDKTTGAPASCRDLAWSHAALIAALTARRAALKRTRRGEGS